MRGIDKRFGTTEALRGVDFEAFGGAVNVVIGENGAGKTTLMRVLFGLTRPDAGEIAIDGRPAGSGYNAHHAIGLGVGMLQQHFSLVPAFSALENIVLGCEPVVGIRIDKQDALERIQTILAELGCRLDIDRRVAELSVSERQHVEIARMLYTGSRILIFDEPTATLAPQEIENIYRLLRGLADDGRTIILITHRLGEVLRHGDNVTVMRRGRVTALFERGGMDERKLIEAIVPDASAFNLEERPALPPIDESAEPIIELRGVDCADSSRRIALRDVEICIRPGEILGIAGVTGSGQKELAETVIGLRPPAAGSLIFMGREIGRLGALRRRAVGIVYIPEDRLADGVVPSFSLVLNRLLGDHRKPAFRRYGSYRIGVLCDDVRDKITRYRIDAGDPEAPLSSLSGGNQQKLMLARELDRQPRLIVAHGPTRGLDVDAARRCYQVLIDLAAAGHAVLLISTELDDLLRFSHRIAVLFAGRLIDAGPSADLDAGKVGLLMTRGSAA
jgi:ABC-type uncharacterized transport system ATPase subunit